MPLVLGSALVCGAAAAADVSISYGTYGAPTSTLVEHGVIPFIEESERLTDGSVSFDLLSGGSVVTTTTALSAVRDGLVDGAQVSSIYFPSELPQLNVTINLAPGIAADTRAVAAATTEMNLLRCPRCKSEIEDWNIQYLGGYGVSSYSLLCREPLATLDDLAGKRVRAPGAFGNLATALGMVPVNVTIAETYEGLQRGQLDCTLGSPGWLTSFSIGDVAKNILLLGMGTAFGGPLLDVSLDKWADLDDAQKDALKRGAALGVVRSATAYEDADAAVLNGAEAAGYTVIEPGEDITTILAEFSESHRLEVIADAERRGIPDAKATVDEFMTVLAKWRTIVTDAEGDEASLVDALYREVYSKF
ncbi:C4-dicarboxylate TRAP transporter substrate-binding protein [Acuticoccus sp. 2012]|uniref:C4-dicarboxylate TRAP transporter substrate-binding protein n=1 Tax=Acuticoccus mangrovi TaxID=2796142 RepID=A0A934MKC9_9HYPH|nr:C4-dicarboxylate TRAP transporter substrate-binding protein [Acuticoccus mangrovi]